MHSHPETDVHDALDSLLCYLENNYYSRLEGLYLRTELHLAELVGTNGQAVVPLYVSLSQKLAGQVAQYLRLRRFGLVPYIRDLLEKEDTGHDCRACSSSCTIRHTAQVAGLRESHHRIKETLFRLQSVAAPLYGQEPFRSEAYRTLRAEVMQLDTALTEVFYLEESSLIPKVLKAQAAIHAHR